ncbi:MAG TPA: hypothetical protein VNM69_11685 [Bacillus sp. (in: firmicutes)]|uniref:hypothetical protein n=1 Tax=Bacillus litorisediminis TaxID=2922713 RepID=UPI001FAF330B|nr:hypothetical protein [Bacillus litorisediminis]HWO76538.1 hypothetical protein [Bacillus sp. (in: firmicutes)]
MIRFIMIFNPEQKEEINMQILIKIQLSIEGTRSEYAGHFPVNNRKFKKDPDWEAAITAYQQIQKIKYETGYRKTEILKVTYNEDKDITELVKRVTPVIKDDLPF